MSLTDAIWRRARSDLILPGAQGEDDLFLFEHSQRVAGGALRIAKCASARVLSPDLNAVLAAALYHDSFWARRVRQKFASRAEVLCRPCTDLEREESAEIMRKALESQLSFESQGRAAQAICSCNERRLSLVEAMIVADAENLDNVGAFGLIVSIRRGMLEGKGVQSLIDQWDRRHQYQYWAAFLKDGFHFPEVRVAAEHRLDSYAKFIEQLRREAEGNDIRL